MSDRKVTVTSGIPMSINECTTYQTLTQTGYSDRRPHWCHSCQLTTGNWLQFAVLLKLDNRKLEKMALLSLDFCCHIWMVEFLA